MIIRRFSTSATMGLAVLLLSFSAIAEDRVDQVWECTLQDGKTLDDLNAAHTAWVNWANKQSYGGDIRGYVSSPIVASDLATVYLIDSYPDLATFQADTILYASEEGQALEEGYAAVSNCTANSLYTVSVIG